MSLIETSHQHVQRDLQSKALLMTDRGELLRARSVRSSAKRTIEKQEQMERQFALMSSRLDRCELLLQELVRHVSILIRQPESLPVAEQE